MNPSVAADAATGGEPGPVRHLRRYSNYLAPRSGFLSADTWVLWAAYLRNFLLNQLVLLPATCAVLLLSRLVGMPTNSPAVRSQCMDSTSAKVMEEYP